MGSVKRWDWVGGFGWVRFELVGKVWYSWCGSLEIFLRIYRMIVEGI